MKDELITKEQAIKQIQKYGVGCFDADDFIPEQAERFVISRLKELPPIKPEMSQKLTNSEWIDFLSEQFDISRTSAKEMLHVMMSVKREDNFKKQFSGRK